MWKESQYKNPVFVFLLKEEFSIEAKEASRITITRAL